MKANSDNKKTKAAKTAEDKKYSLAKVFARLISDMKPIGGWLTLIVFLSIAGVGVSLATPDLIGKLTDSLYSLWADGIPVDMNAFGRNCLILMGIYLLSAVLSLGTQALMSNTVSRFYTYGLRVRISDKIRRLPVSYVDKTPVGELLSRMMDDVSNMSMPIYDMIGTLINGLVKLVGISIIIFLINARIAAVIITVVPVSVLLAAIISSKSEKFYNKSREVNGKLYALTEEDFTGFDTVKAFNLENSRNDKFANLADEYKKRRKKADFLSSLVQPVITFTNAAAYVLICVIGGYMAINGTLSVGDVVTLVLYAQMFAGPLESIAQGMAQIQNTVASARRVYQIFDSPEMTVTSGETLPEQIGEVRFQNVCFSYDPAKTLIKNLSFTAKEGQKVAIVGATGGGKTTIVNLLMRFYEIQGGNIYIGGKDIMKMDAAELRSMFSMVLQDTWLFSGSIFENVAFGKTGATREEVRLACQKAHVDHFICTLKDGYDTLINEETSNISGGQKQLLTIARAYLADRKILILDEATSNVDTRTELLIQRTMDELMQNRTSFVIAHRLSTIVDADVILVVDRGAIVEQGTHKELLAKGGAYAKIYNSQYELLK